MSRPIFPEQRIHPEIRQAIASNHRDVIDEVEKAIGENDVVLVGMAMNPYPRKARALLTARGVPFRYLEYGSYLGMWRRRNVLKMWTGWPTFPMIWIKGTFIGGAAELGRLAKSGELDRMLGR